MIHDRRLSFALPIVVAALLLPPAAEAQQAAPSQAQPARPRPASPAPKPAAPAAGATQPQLLGQFGDWGAYTASPSGRKVCFALAKPSKSQTNPPNRPRDPTYIFVSTRPAEKVKDEVSVIIGYTFKPNTDATAEVGGASFAMYTQNDGAWIKNAAEESRLVDAMRKGAELTIKGVSARGTTTTDVYSLRGLGQALDRVAQECR